ncbi:hypothetical protein HYPSUDRAFT_37948 [Hypholoma sublateritium FD-334 SS-4]|uniref:F-box domain-containing protein n=1 Tax=Hypholoma sublateritium (strain FD-334 SS-4) TaxID=945553 RepID=A0A0D2P266_HYPSF|nr:hypothetical protein HYPSUDRAFT_37948 [Hypholoma sublateritium FD-334 SS-4]
MVFPTSSLKLLDLPTELLVEISWQSNNENLVLVCTHICNIIHSTPLFWGYIHIGEHQHTEDAAAFLAKRLERGGTCPVEVSIQTTQLTAAVFGIALWRTLAAHKDRIRSLAIKTDLVLLSGQVIRDILLLSESAIRPSLQKLDIRPVKDDLLFGATSPFAMQVVRGPIPIMFPALTTLILANLHSWLPDLTCPLPTLETLVLDGSVFFSWRGHPAFPQLVDLLSKVPHLHTLWYKEHCMNIYSDPIDTSPIGSNSNAAHITFPILLPRLTRLAVTVPGAGAWLLQAIDAPALRDLHMDGMRDDEELGDAGAWLDIYPVYIHTVLCTAAARSPALRRIALVGAYLARSTWEWLLGCGPEPGVPFPLLESVAVRAMEPVKWQVTNMADDALLELYAQQGRVSLRRFAYTASEPRISGHALHQLIGSIVKRQAAGELFELEMDGQYGVDTEERLIGLLDMGIKAILHIEPFPPKCWWNLGKDIDPSEADSY